MAQVVGFFQDNFEFTEGPFVVCCVNSNKYRIEAKHGASRTSVLPEPEIIKYLKTTNQIRANDFRSSKAVAPIVDELNMMVQAGRIVLQGNVWNFIQL